MLGCQPLSHAVPPLHRRNGSRAGHFPGALYRRGGYFSFWCASLPTHTTTIPHTTTPHQSPAHFTPPCRRNRPVGPTPPKQLHACLRHIAACGSPHPTHPTMWPCRRDRTSRARDCGQLCRGCQAGGLVRIPGCGRHRGQGEGHMCSPSCDVRAVHAVLCVLRGT